MVSSQFAYMQLFRARKKKVPLSSTSTAHPLPVLTSYQNAQTILLLGKYPHSSTLFTTYSELFLLRLQNWACFTSRSLSIFFQKRTVCFSASNHQRGWSSLFIVSDNPLPMLSFTVILKTAWHKYAISLLAKHGMKEICHLAWFITPLSHAASFFCST